MLRLAGEAHRLPVALSSNDCPPQLLMRAERPAAPRQPAQRQFALDQRLHESVRCRP